MYLILITFVGEASIFSLIFPAGREKRIQFGRAMALK